MFKVRFLEVAFVRVEPEARLQFQSTRPNIALNGVYLTVYEHNARKFGRGYELRCL